MTEHEIENFDVVVVGGGTAGLSGALMLGRSRRTVLVVDAGEPRNAPAAHAHGFLTRDGIAPHELVELGRAEVRGYGGEVRAGRVRSASPAPDGFVVELDGGAIVHARRLLLATGLVDELPDVPGVRERWGRDVLHCPYCHGWEVRDRAIGILGTNAWAVHQALLFGQWTSAVTLFLHTAPEPTDQESEQLAARGVRIVRGEVAELVVADDRLTGVRLATGTEVPCDALVVLPRFVAHPLDSLGLTTTEHPMGVGTFVDADPTGRTAVPGVWAAGNLADPMAQLIGAAATGSRAGAMINADLVTEDVERVVASRRHHHDHGRTVFDQAFWDERYRSADTIWSGRPNPQLVAEAADLDPGTALDVGCGEGADAIWLAQRGWRVTAVDISTVALERGAAQARAAGVADRITWQQVDLLDGLPDATTYDFVSAQFMHLPTAQRRRLHEQLAAVVAPGGSLLVVGHHPYDMAVVPRPPAAELYFTTSDVAGSLDPREWDVVVDQDRPRPAVHPDGNAVTIRDAVLRARRRDPRVAITVGD